MHLICYLDHVVTAENKLAIMLSARIFKARWPKSSTLNKRCLQSVNNVFVQKALGRGQFQSSGKWGTDCFKSYCLKVTKWGKYYISALQYVVSCFT